MNNKIQEIIKFIEEKKLSEKEKDSLINYLTTSSTNTIFMAESFSPSPKVCPTCGKKL